MEEGDCNVCMTKDYTVFGSKCCNYDICISCMARQSKCPQCGEIYKKIKKRKIIDYYTVATTNNDTIAAIRYIDDRVNDEISKGYTPYGNIVCNERVIVQAIVKYSE